MHTQRITFGGGQTLSLETGKLAKQADGAVIVRQGDTMVLVTACHAASPREGIDFLPLTVDYRENTYASGRIPGGFFKREGKPPEKRSAHQPPDRSSDPAAVPVRLALRDAGRRLVISADTENDSDVLALTGAGPPSPSPRSRSPSRSPACASGSSTATFLVNPTYDQRRKSRLDLIVAGTADAIVMVEAGAKEVSEDEMVIALDTAHKAIKDIIAGTTELAAKVNKPKLKVSKREIGHDFYREVETRVLGPLADAMRIQDKLENYGTVDTVLKNLVASFPEDEVQQRADAKQIFKDLKEKVLRDEILEHGKRLDGRKFDEIRPIWSEVGVLPRVHGSTVFTRGETQALVTCTLGTADDQQKIEGVDGEIYKRFMLHYNFPPFSVGEVSFLRGPGRREIGHGALAERALVPVMPTEEQFPYTVRVVSDILESNGSSSMASVCGGSLAMMDAGVPLAAPVAGMAMGLVMNEENGKFAVLSDIAGAEDHYGDMDFKVAGTAKGITALQMDIKVGGITMEIMRQALEQALQGRLFILGKMAETLAAPRKDVSLHAPRIVTIKIPVDKIRDVIGPGGKMIRSIIERTGVKIDVEDDGRVNVASTDEASAAKAIAIIQELTATAELNKTYLGKVQRITDFGAFVEILPGLDGLLHVSEIANHRVKEASNKRSWSR